MEPPNNPEDLKGKQGRTSGPVKRSTKNWTPEEDEVLLNAVECFKGKNWKKIAECLKDRTASQCVHRWRQVLNPDIKKGSWSKEEDEKLIALVQQYGQQWSTISQHLPGRIGKQCRERWYNHLDPGINKKAWTKEEELTLISAHQICGNKWAELTKFLPGRSDNSIKNYWNNSLKWRLDSYHASNPADQCQSLPLTALKSVSIAASSSRMHISGDEGNSRPEVDAEESKCSQASNVFSQSTNYVLDELSPGNEILYTPKYHSGAEQQISNTASHAEPCSPSFDDVNPKISYEADCSKKFQNLNPSHEVRTTTAKNDPLQGVSNDAKQDLDLDLLTPKMDDTGKNQALQSLVRLGDQPSSLNLDTDPETEMLFTDEEWRSILRNDDDDGITEQQELSYIPKESVKLVPPNSLTSPSRANKISFPTEDKPAEKDKRALSDEPSRSPSAVDPSFDNNDDFWSDPYRTYFLENEEGRSFDGNDDDDGITEQQELSYIRKKSLKLMPPNSWSSPSRANKSSFPIEDKQAEKGPQSFPEADSPFYTCDLRPSRSVFLGDHNFAYLFPPSNPLLSSDINSDVTRGWQVEVIAEVNRPTSFVEGSLVEKKDTTAMDDQLHVEPLNSFSSPSRVNKISFPIDDKPAEKDEGALCYESSRSPSAVDPCFDNKDDHGPSNDDTYFEYFTDNSDDVMMDIVNNPKFVYFGDTNVSVGLDDSDSFPTIRTTHHSTSPTASDPLLSSNINSDASPDVQGRLQVEVIAEVNRPRIEGSLAEKKEDSFRINTESSASSSSASVTSSSRIDVEVSGNNVDLGQNPVKKCMHCGTTKILQWRAGSMGPKTLCNACGLRYKSGRLHK